MLSIIIGILFVLIALISLATFVGLINPKALQSKKDDKVQTRGEILKFGFGGVVFFLVVILILSAFTDDSENKVDEQKNIKTAKKPEVKEKKKNANNPEKNGMGVTYAQATQGFDKLMTFKLLPLNDGRTRYQGKYSHAVVEIIGDKQNIEEASLTIGLSQKDQNVIAVTALTSQQFLKNIFPNKYQELFTWMTKSIPKAVKEKKDYYINRAGKRLRLMWIHGTPLGLLIVKKQ